MKENDGKIEEKEKIRVLLYFSKNLFSVNFISRKTKRSIMMKKIFVPFVSLVMSIGFFAACSNDSDSANSQVSGPVNSTVAKVESASFTAENQSNCGMKVGLMKSESETDSVHLYMNKDGSAVMKEKMQSICPHKGEVSNITLEKSKDTLHVSIEYYEYTPDTVVVYNESLEKNDTLIMSRYPTPKCGGICSADYEINVPAEFVGSKFVSVNRSGNAKVYPIAYVKEE